MVSRRINDIYLLMDRSDVKELKSRPIDDSIKGLMRLLTIPEYDYLDTDKYFEKNGIPMEFRKMAVILHRPFTSNKEAEESRLNRTRRRRLWRQMESHKEIRLL